MSQWYKIDNTGKIFHAVSSSSNSAVYRVSATLYEKIDPEVLQEALDIVAIRFPTLMVRVRKGLFWDFLEANDDSLLVKEETDYPCAPIDRKENNAFLIRVLYFNKRISVEVFHSVTDGGGAQEFLKTLVYQYLNLMGKNIMTDGTILLPEDEVDQEESEDSFVRYVNHSEPAKSQDKDQKAYQLSGTELSPRGINLVQGIMDAGALNTFAKSQGTSLTGLLTSVLILTIYEERKKNSDAYISVAIPVNLRKVFPSKTMRNFFSVSNIGVQVKKDMTMDEIIEAVTRELIKKTEKSFLQRGINHFVSFQKNLLLRIVPVFIKYPIMRFAFNSVGENRKTLTLTNLGNVKVPDEMRPYIDWMDIVLYPTKKSPINCGAATINNKLTMTFARSIDENEFIKAFFKNLTRMTGLEVTVHSNGWGE